MVKAPISTQEVGLILLLFVAFLISTGGPSLVARIQALGPLKLASGTQREIARLRPDVERELRSMPLSWPQPYLGGTATEGQKREAERTLARIGPLLTLLRLTETPRTLPDDLKASYHLLSNWEGQLLYRLGFYEEAAVKWESLWQDFGPEFLARVGERGPQIANLCIYLGCAYTLRAKGVDEQPLREHLLQRSLEWFRRGIAYDPDSVAGYFNLAWVYDELGFYMRAIETLDQLLAMGKFIHGIYNRACPKAKAGSLKEAMADLKSLPCPHEIWATAKNDSDFNPIRESEYGSEFGKLVSDCSGAGATGR